MLPCPSRTRGHPGGQLAALSYRGLQDAPYASPLSPAGAERLDGAQPSRSRRSPPNFERRLHAPGRVGWRRRPGLPPPFSRRLPHPRPTATPLPRRRGCGQAAPGRPRRARPLRPAVRGVPRTPACDEASSSTSLLTQLSGLARHSGSGCRSGRCTTTATSRSTDS